MSSIYHVSQRAWFAASVLLLAAGMCLPGALFGQDPKEKQIKAVAWSDDRPLPRSRSVYAAHIAAATPKRRANFSALSAVVVVLLPDQAVLPREGVLVPFVGRPAWTTPIPAKMALRRASEIVFAFCIPHETGHRLEFENPIRVDQLSAAESDPVMLTERINDVISRRITDRPELWLWMHDRWKGTAIGESEGMHGE